MKKFYLIMSYICSIVSTSLLTISLMAWYIDDIGVLELLQESVDAYQACFDEGHEECKLVGVPINE